MSNYIAQDVKYLWKWAWTYFPWRITWKPPTMTRIVRRMWWQQTVKDGWFLGWPLWFGKKRGKG